jgi:hypothetical protein
MSWVLMILFEAPMARITPNFKALVQR